MRGKQFLCDNGLGATFLQGVRWLVTRPKLLIYEPVKRLPDIARNPNFDQLSQAPRVAVQLHVFSPKLLDELIDYTNRIPYRFDCFVSTDTEEKAADIRSRMIKRSRAERVNVAVYPNRGRDVAPLLLQLASVIPRYDYLLHLHTKGSVHGNFGDRWRRYLLDSLLASSDYIAAILQCFEDDPKLGLVFQRTYWRVKPSLGWKHNCKPGEAFMSRLGLTETLPAYPQFPAGNMFWARAEAVMPMFQAGLTMDDFPEEAQQLNGTPAHCAERCWGCVTQQQGYTYLRVTRKH